MKSKAYEQTVPNWKYDANSWIIIPPTPKIKKFKLSANVSGSTEPIKTKWPTSLINGDFVVGANCSKVPIVGDGSDEHTAWDFDFRQSKDWNKICVIREIFSVIISISLIGHTDVKAAKLKWFSTDNKYSGVLIEGLFKDAILSKPSTTEFDLLKELKTTSSEILHLLLIEPQGVLRFHFEDDALLTSAKCTIEGSAYML